MSRRVLHLDGDPGFRGGQRQLLFLAVGQLRDPALQVHVLCRSLRLQQQLEAAGVSVRRWAGPSHPVGALRARQAMARADLVHAHDARSHALARFFLPAAAALIVHRRVDDVPHSRALTRWKYGAGDVVCVSSAIRDGLAAWGVPPERLIVVSSAVEIPDEVPVRPMPETPLRLLAHGALVAHKGHRDLLEALVQVDQPWSLELAGQGPLRGPLEAQAMRLGLAERVSFLGEAGDGAEARARADLFVQPSRTEGLGTAVLDALAGGLPVVATRAGGLPEIVHPERTGWLASPADPSSLAVAIGEAVALSSDDPEAFAERGRRGWAFVRARHRVPQMLAGVRAVYDRPR